MELIQQEIAILTLVQHKNIVELIENYTIGYLYSNGVIERR